MFSIFFTRKNYRKYLRIFLENEKFFTKKYEKNKRKTFQFLKFVASSCAKIFALCKKFRVFCTIFLQKNTQCKNATKNCEKNYEKNKRKNVNLLIQFIKWNFFRNAFEKTQPLSDLNKSWPRFVFDVLALRLLFGAYINCQDQNVSDQNNLRPSTSKTNPCQPLLAQTGALL